MQGETHPFLCSLLSGLYLANFVVFFGVSGNKHNYHFYTFSSRNIPLCGLLQMLYLSNNMGKSTIKASAEYVNPRDGIVYAKALKGEIHFAFYKECHKRSR